MDVVKARSEGGLAGSSPTILASWKLGVTLQYFSPVSNGWRDRSSPMVKKLPDPTGWYRLKPKE